MKRVALLLCAILLACAADFSGGNVCAQQVSKPGKRAYPKPVVSERNYPVEATGKTTNKILRVYHNSSAFKVLQSSGPLSER
jgi:hypothetical protein